MGHFLGIDLGSSFTKLVAVDGSGGVVFKAVVPTRSRRREAFDSALAQARSSLDLRKVCTTGYGRRSMESDLQKTELVCAAAGVSLLHPQRKCILDIGGEDIKIIESGPDGQVLDFYMNDKCSAGTGTFITEIAERAELDVTEMSRLSEGASSGQTMNSFCTVFAKSEILGWKFGGVPPEEIARGIYLSVVDRVGKLPVKKGLPLFLCGGVIAYHPILARMFSERFGIPATIVADPQFSVALGAAELARRAGAGAGGQ